MEILNNVKVVLLTGLGALIALIVAVFSSSIFNGLAWILMIDKPSGSLSYWLAIFWVGLLTHAGGGYFAIWFVSKFLKGANFKWVCILFCLIIVNMFFFILVATFNLEETIKQSIIIFSILGAYGAYLDYKKSE